MPYNPNLPADHSEIVAAELRNQLNALKALYDGQQATITAQAAQIAALQTALNAKPSMDDVNAAIVANSSANVNSMEGLDNSPSDPPTQGDVLQLYYFGNNLLNALKRPS